MYAIIKTIFRVILNILRLLTRVCVVTLLILCMVFVLNVNDYLVDIDTKTDIIAQVFTQYNKTMLESMLLVLKSQNETIRIVETNKDSITKSFKDLEKYVTNKSDTLEKQINDKTVLPNFLYLTKSKVF